MVKRLSAPNEIHIDEVAPEDTSKLWIDPSDDSGGGGGGGSVNYVKSTTVDTITASTVPPADPNIGDIWIDLS